MSAAPRLVAAEPSEPPHPAAYELRWDAPTECPSREALIEQIEDLLTAPPSGSGVAVISGTVSRSEGQYALRLTTEFRGRLDHRDFSASSCDELATATTLLIAVALEPSLGKARDVPHEDDTTVDEAPPPSRIPLPTIATEPESPSPPTTQHAEQPPSDLRTEFGAPRTEARPNRARPRGLARLGVGPEWGALAAATAGFELSLGFGWPRARVLLHGLYLAPHRHRYGSGRGGLHQLGSVGARGCGVVRARSIGFPLCGGLEGGTLRVDSRGLEPASTRFGPWLGPLLSAGLERHWERVGIFADLEFVGRAVGSATRVDGVVEVEQFVVSSRLLAGIELRFP